MAKVQNFIVISNEDGHTYRMKGDDDRLDVSYMTQATIVKLNVEKRTMPNGHRATICLTDDNRYFAVYSDFSAVEIEMASAKAKKTAVKKPAASNLFSKKALFTKIVVDEGITTRAAAIEMAVDVLGMSKAGASTYWANYNKA